MGTNFISSPGRFIPVAEAKELTARYRAEHPDAVRAELFSAELLQQLLSRGTAIRIYYGQQDTNPQLLLVAVDAEGRDILPTSDTDGVLAFGQPCPTICDPTSALNG
ncbi:hypothetical protein GCM10023187_53820 [Nibrella viscosa]|uniref:Uncharacterized protein n=1 Tax=Nibrella viscosa TaxID=1084524 RepID=A0ABP8L031_9BACT